MPEYRTPAQASQLADEADPVPRLGSEWWIRRHTARGPQLAHSVKTGTLLAYGSAIFTGGRLRIRALCAQLLRTPDYDTFEIAPAPETLPDGWRACPRCRTALET